MRSFTRLILTAALAALVSPASAGADKESDQAASAEQRVGDDVETGTLIVNIENLASDDGNLRLVLFDSPQNFLKRPVRAEIVAIEGRQGTWTVQDLPYGVYAVLVHHDLDGSGIIERHWYGKPKEPTGASNDAPARFGPPKFKDAKFVFATRMMTIQVAVR